MFSLKTATLPRMWLKTAYPPIGPGEQHHRRPVAESAATASSRLAASRSGSRRWKTGRCAARGEGDEVRFQGNRRGELLVHDLLQHEAADGQVGVGEILAHGADFSRDPTVRPAPHAAGVQGLRIAQAGGEGVSQGDVVVSMARRAGMCAPFSGLCRIAEAGRVHNASNTPECAAPLGTYVLAPPDFRVRPVSFLYHPGYVKYQGGYTMERNPITPGGHPWNSIPAT